MINLRNKKQIDKGSTKVLGITGTKGKTIITDLVKHVLQESGFRVAYISSQDYSTDSTNVRDDMDANNITKKQFNTFYEESIGKQNDFVVIEMPLEKIADGFYSDVLLDVGVLSNTHEQNEIDSQSLSVTKLRFINLIEDQGTLYISSEDKGVIEWLNANQDKVENDIFCYWADSTNLPNRKYSLSGIMFDFYDQGHVDSKLLGYHNYLNIYLAVKVCEKFVPLEKVLELVKKFEPTKGRFHLDRTNPYNVIVDSSYHTDSLKRSLQYLNAVRNPLNKIITVYGTPGRKDLSHRNAGSIAAEMSDYVILAPNDPNTEHVSDINSEIHKYAESRGGVLAERIYSSSELEMLDRKHLNSRLSMILDDKKTPFITFDAHDYTGRLDSIRFALELADPGDIIYIVGKGDDTSITFNNIEYEWSDYEAIRRAINGLS